MEAFREALYAAARHVIEGGLYAAMPPPDDIDDVTLHLDAAGQAGVARLRDAIADSDDARRALLLTDEDAITDETAQALLQRWVSAYRDLTDQLRTFHRARADELFRDLEAMAERETVPMVVTTPIFLFQMDANELRLGEDLAIFSRRANLGVRRDIDLAWSSVLMDGAAPRDVPNFAIRSRFEAARSRFNADPALDRHERVVSALRLLRAQGAPYIGPHLVAVERPALRLPHVPARHVAISRGSPQFDPFAERYALPPAENRRLAEIVQDLEELRDDATLTFALRRFGASYSRSRGDDKIVDYWIALESMFSGESGEVTYRISMRAARFIGATVEERTDLRQRLKRSYGVRSKIVHGRHVDPRDVDETEAQTADLLRQAIHRWLEVHGTSAEALDRALLE